MAGQANSSGGPMSNSGAWSNSTIPAHKVHSYGSLILPNSPIGWQTSALQPAEQLPSTPGDMNGHAQSGMNSQKSDDSNVVYTAVHEKQARQHKEWCEQHKYRYVLARTRSGLCTDGFIEHIDDQVLCLAVPYGLYENRAFFPYYPTLYPYPYYPRRRFYRQVFPLAGLLALSLLPFY